MVFLIHKKKGMHLGWELIFILDLGFNYIFYILNSLARVKAMLLS